MTTIRIALRLCAVVALGVAAGALAIGTAATFGISLAGAMALGIASDLIDKCQPNGQTTP